METVHNFMANLKLCFFKFLQVSAYNKNYGLLTFNAFIKPMIF